MKKQIHLWLAAKGDDVLIIAVIVLASVSAGLGAVLLVRVWVVSIRWLLPSVWSAL